MTTAALRLDATWVVPVEPTGVLPEHSVVIGSDGRILAVDPTAVAAARFPDAERVDLAGHVLIPGLINAHTHAAMTLLRGFADDEPLDTWLTERIWPAEARLVSPQFVHDGTALACLEMVLGGTTTFADMYFFPDEAIRAARRFGIRMQAGITYLRAATAYARSEEEYLARGLAVREAFSDDPLVTFALAPHATYSTSAESLPRLRRLMDEHDLRVHIHLHETPSEVSGEVETHGMSGVRRLADAGVLGPALSAAHCVVLSDGDLDVLASSGASVVHCPTSNLKLASGIAPVARLHEAGVNVALGTDGAASNNRLDMFAEMRLAALLAKGTTGRADVVTAQEALRMATLGGAKALGIGDQTGSLEVGKWADVIAVDVTGPLSVPVYDPVSHLVHVAERRDVTDVWSAGRPVVSAGRSVVDASDVLARVDGWRMRARADDLMSGGPVLPVASRPPA